MSFTAQHFFNPSPPVLPLSCCAFCLRTRPSNAEFHKQVTECSREQRQCFQLILGYDFRLDSFAVCKPCWKLMELVQDFRLRCLKANSLLGRVCEGKLLPIAKKDGWFLEKVLTDIENFRTEIQRQLQEMIVLEKDAEKPKTEEVNEIKDEPIDISDDSNESSQLFSEMESGSDDKSNSSAHKISIEKTSLGFYKCMKCGASYTTSKGVREHVQTCDGTYNVLTCNICKATFTADYLMKQHMMRHENGMQNQTRYRCRQTSVRSFSTQSNRLQEHHKLVHPRLRHLCKTCDKKFINKKQLRTHERRVHPEGCDVPCPECGRMYSVAIDLMEHLKSEKCGERVREKETHAAVSEPAEQTLDSDCERKTNQRKEKESTESRDRQTTTKGLKLKSIQIITP